MKSQDEFKRSFTLSEKDLIEEVYRLYVSDYDKLYVGIPEQFVYDSYDGVILSQN